VPHLIEIRSIAYSFINLDIYLYDYFLKKINIVDEIFNILFDWHVVYCHVNREQILSGIIKFVPELMIEKILTKLIPVDDTFAINFLTNRKLITN